MNKCFEFFICTCVLLLALPFFLIAALITFATLGRPIFFKQVRSGRNGTVFCLVKLRTMRNSRGANGELLPDLERQTRFGAWLRRLRLDEFPQILHILCGQMALVGPRPLLPETVESFGTDGVLRGTVQPGLTGWSQVSGNTTLSNEEKLKLDLWYVAHRSTALDFQILLETLGVALFGEHRQVNRLEEASSWCAVERNAKNAEVSS